MNRTPEPEIYFDVWAIVYGVWAHEIFFVEDEANAELARLQALYPGYDLSIEHVHYDSDQPQSPQWHDGGFLMNPIRAERK